MIAAVVLGALVAAALMAIGARLSPPAVILSLTSRSRADGRLLAALGGPVAVTLLIGVILGASAPQAGSMLVAVVVALILLAGAASGWAWLLLSRST